MSEDLFLPVKLTSSPHTSNENETAHFPLGMAGCVIDDWLKLWPPVAAPRFLLVCVYSSARNLP